MQRCHPARDLLFVLHVRVFANFASFFSCAHVCTRGMENRLDTHDIKQKVKMGICNSLIILVYLLLIGIVATKYLMCNRVD